MNAATVTPPAAFVQSVLAGIGAPDTPANVAFLTAWGQHESPPQSIDPNNYLGTTRAAGGSHGTNGPGVQAYPSLFYGVQATIATLNQDNFVAIKTALQTGNPEQFRNSAPVQAAFKLWSGGGYTWPTSGSSSSGGGILGTLGKVGKTAADVGTLGVTGEIIGGGYLPTVGDVTGAITSPLTGWVGDVTKWITGEAALGLAYIVFTVLGVALILLGGLEVFGYTPGRLLGSPAAGAPGSSQLAKGEILPF